MISLLTSRSFPHTWHDCYYDLNGAVGTTRLGAQDWPTLLWELRFPNAAPVLDFDYCVHFFSLSTSQGNVFEDSTDLPTPLGLSLGSHSSRAVIINIINLIESKVFKEACLWKCS